MIGPKRFLRGVIHFHSRFSYDSWLSISAYLRFAKKHSLDFVVLTDHDTIAGSVALRDAAAKRLPSLQVPIAAEYYTDEGDVIAMFLANEIREESYPHFKASARAQNALLLLPHPFIAHRSPEMVARDCDLVEAFNSRAKPSENHRAQQLGISCAKPMYAATDAHLRRSLGNAILEVEDLGDLRRSLLQGEVRWDHAHQTPLWEIGASQLIKAWKQRKLALALQVIGAGLRGIVKKR